MKVYQELFGLYLLFGALVVMFVLLILVFFVFKMKKKRIMSNENRSIYLTLNDGNNETPILRNDKRVTKPNVSSKENRIEKVIDVATEINMPENNTEEGNDEKAAKTQTRNKENKKSNNVTNLHERIFLVADNPELEESIVSQNKPVVLRSIPKITIDENKSDCIGSKDEKASTNIKKKLSSDKIPVVVITRDNNDNSNSIESNLSDINDGKEDFRDEPKYNSKRNELQDRYQVIRKELDKKSKYSIAYDGLIKKVDEIGIKMQRIVNLKDDDKIANTITSTIEISLIELENAIKEAPLIVKLYQRTIPLKIKEKVHEYDKLKFNDVKVNNKVINEIKEILVLLQECESKILKIDFGGALSELKKILAKIDAINIEVNDNEKQV